MNRKRFAAAALSLLLSLVLCLAVLPGMAEADGVDDILTPPSNPGDLVLWIQAWETLVGQWDDNYTQPGNLQYEKIRDDTEIMITGVENGQDLDRLAIPAVLDGLPVTAIGPGAFAGLDIYFAILPNSLTAIGEGAFTGCNLMHTLSVPFIGPSRDSASNLGYLGVSGAGGAALLQVFVTDAAKIADGAFSGCSGLKTIQFLGHRENVTMGDSAFSGCTGLESLVLPEGLSSVGDYAFQNCTSFKEFTVPDSVQTMGCGAFKGCTNLEKLTLPFVGKERGISEQSEAVFGYIFGGSPYDGATQIAQFWNPSNRTGNFIPDSLRSVTVNDESVVPYGAFQNCTMLRQITYPAPIDTVGDRAYDNCPAVIVVMCYTTETGEIATLETAREAGKVNLNLTLDEKLAEEAPTVFFAVYDVQGRMILLKEWTEVETGVPFEQSIVLPDGVDLGRVQTMVLSDKSIPLMNAFRLT